MQHLEIKICTSIDEAIADGFVYPDTEYTKITLKRAVVVQGGTKNGNSTVDLIFEDDSGKKYQSMNTSAIIKSIPAFEK